MRVDQVIPSLVLPDAIGRHTLTLRDTLRAAGIDSDIYYGFCPVESLRHEGRPVDELGRARRGRWLLYQASIGSTLCDVVAARPEPLLVNYHNITPAPLLEGWAPDVGFELRLGRAQLPRLAGRCELAMAVSAFNEEELHQAGYRRTEVVPLLVEMTDDRQVPDADILERLQKERAEGGADLLFVGKVSPHKAPHDLVKMLSALRRLYDPGARLHLVGSPLCERYGLALRDLVTDLGLDGAVEVTGSISPAELEAYYQCADVLVCASEHEGFCAPLIEAMAHGVPIVAYRAGAVPETVAAAGIILDTKEPLHFAATVARVLDDVALRDRLHAVGHHRAADFSLERSKARLLQAIGTLASA